MDNSTLLLIFAGAVTVSVVIQTCLLFGMYKATQTLRERVMTTLPKVEALMDASKIAVEEGRTAISEIREKSNVILDAGQKQMKQLDALLTDASERTARQLAYAEAVVEDALNRIEDTVTLVHKGVLKPIRGITGVAAGIGAAIQFLMNRRGNPRSATVDEEMFI